MAKVTAALIDGQPAFVWAFWANLYGPRYSVPRPAHWDGKTWWDVSGNHEVEVLGETVSKEGDVLVFASTDKKEVTQYMRGFMAQRRLLASAVALPKSLIAPRKKTRVR